MGNVATMQNKTEEHDDAPAQAQKGDSLYDQAFLDEIKEAHADLENIKESREALNARKAEIIARLVDKGLNKDALQAARRYELTPEEKRAGYDLSYQIVRKALGVPVQDDLFAAAAQRQVDQHVAGKQ